MRSFISFFSVSVPDVLFCHTIRTVMACLIYLSYLKVFHYCFSLSAWSDFSHAHHHALVQTLWKGLLIRDKPAMLLLGLDRIMHNLHRCFRALTFSAWSFPSTSFYSSLTNLKSTAALHRTYIPALKRQTL